MTPDASPAPAPSDSHDGTRRRHRRHRHPGGHPQPQHGLGHKLSAEEINRHPLAAYEGPIHVVETPEQAEEAARAIGCETLLGFDTETRPAFRKGESYPPALLQLAGAQAVWIFKLACVGLPPGVVAILSDASVIKVGVSNAHDLEKLRGLREFVPAGFVDLGHAAKRAGIPHHGLRGLATVLLGCRISKGAQLTNWSQPNLSPRSLQYAATDPWIGRRIYEAMLAKDVFRTPATEKTAARPRGHRPGALLLRLRSFFRGLWPRR